MTIAVSVVVHPSRSLSLSIYAMASMALVAAFLILFGQYELSWISRLQIFAIVSIFAVATIFKAGRPRKTFHIDISGIGQIRLTQYSGESANRGNSDLALDGDSGLEVHLSSGSVLWPYFLLLRLKPEEGTVLSVPVLPDSLKGPGFAELSVAFRYIAARDAKGKIID
nr:protein YgfX [uncultured Noviherbaspirillum sp.]